MYSIQLTLFLWLTIMEQLGSSDRRAFAIGSSTVATVVGKPLGGIGALGTANDRDEAALALLEDAEGLFESFRKNLLASARVSLGHWKLMAVLGVLTISLDIFLGF